MSPRCPSLPACGPWTSCFFCHVSVTVSVTSLSLSPSRSVSSFSSLNFLLLRFCVSCLVQKTKKQKRSYLKPLMCSDRFLLFVFVGWGVFLLLSTSHSLTKSSAQNVLFSFQSLLPNRIQSPPHLSSSFGFSLFFSFFFFSFFWGGGAVNTYFVDICFIKGLSADAEIS